MTNVACLPENKNFLLPVGFKLEVPRAPNFNYFIQSVDMPGIRLPRMEAPTPFRPLNLPAEHIDYDTLSVTFKLDEDLKGYFEMYEWMKQLGRPESGEQAKAIYNEPPGTPDGIYNQIALMFLDSKMTPNIKFSFIDALPTRLSGFTMRSDAEDITYITASMDFTFRDFKYQYV